MDMHKYASCSRFSLPIPTRDADFIQDLVRQKINEERAVMVFGIAMRIGQQRPGFIGLRYFHTGPVRPNNPTDRALGRAAIVFSLDEYGDREKNAMTDKPGLTYIFDDIDRVEEKERNKRYGDYDPVHFEGLVKKRQERQGPMIVIKVSSKIVDITTIERIEKRIYLDEIFDE